MSDKSMCWSNWSKYAKQIREMDEESGVIEIEGDLCISQVTNKELSDKIDDLNQKLDDIFGGHVLVKGRWVQIKESFQSILASIVGIKK